MNALQWLRRLWIRGVALDWAGAVLFLFGPVPALLGLAVGVLLERRYFPVPGLWALLLPVVAVLLLLRHATLPLGRSAIAGPRELWRSA